MQGPGADVRCDHVTLCQCQWGGGLRVGGGGGRDVGDDPVHELAKDRRLRAGKKFESLGAKGG